MRISETIELNIPDGTDIDKPERYLAKETKRFGKQLFGRVLEQMETKKVEDARGVVSRREKVPRWSFNLRNDIIWTILYQTAGILRSMTEGRKADFFSLCNCSALSDEKFKGAFSGY